MNIWHNERTVRPTADPHEAAVVPHATALEYQCRVATCPIRTSPMRDGAATVHGRSLADVPQDVLGDVPRDVPLHVPQDVRPNCAPGRDAKNRPRPSRTRSRRRNRRLVQ